VELLLSAKLAKNKKTDDIIVQHFIENALIQASKLNIYLNIWISPFFVVILWLII